MRALCMNEYDRNIVSLLSKLFNVFAGEEEEDPDIFGRSSWRNIAEDDERNKPGMCGFCRTRSLSHPYQAFPGPLLQCHMVKIIFGPKNLMNDGEFCTSPNREQWRRRRRRGGGRGEGEKKPVVLLRMTQVAATSGRSVGRKEDSKVDLLSSFSCHFYLRRSRQVLEL